MSTDHLKLYCYVDETGQDARSSQFIVVSVIIISDPDHLREILQIAERDLGKRQRKWTKATVSQRLAYVERLLGVPDLQGAVYFSRFPKPANYPESTFIAVAHAIRTATGGRDFRAHVFIDGLSATERQRGTQQLRTLYRGVKKVRGLRDENDEFIRLADTFVGLDSRSLRGSGLRRALVQTGN